VALLSLRREICYSHAMRRSESTRPLLVLLVLSALAGCTGELAELGPEPGRYFPRRVGATREYAVTDSLYTTAGWRVRSYRRRETAQSELPDQAGRPQLRLALDTASGAVPFTSETAHWHTLTTEYAERLEGSDRVLVLARPLLLGQSWNGNAYNTRGTESFVYTDLDTAVTLTVNGTSRRFDTCVRVQQRRGVRRVPQGAMPDGDIRVDTWELYAPEVGMIVRVDRNIRTDLLGQLVADGTTVRRQVLIATSY